MTNHRHLNTPEPTRLHLSNAPQTRTESDQNRTNPNKTEHLTAQLAVRSSKFASGDQKFISAEKISRFRPPESAPETPVVSSWPYTRTRPSAITPSSANREISCELIPNNSPST